MEEQTTWYESHPVFATRYTNMSQWEAKVSGVCPSRVIPYRLYGDGAESQRRLASIVESNSRCLEKEKFDVLTIQFPLAPYSSTLHSRIMLLGLDRPPTSMAQRRITCTNATYVKAAGRTWIFELLAHVLTCCEGHAFRAAHLELQRFEPLVQAKLCESPLVRQWCASSS